ncbi:MAG: hypothetical protein ABJA71_10400, partial [Ginsengibacter sp.]
VFLAHIPSRKLFGWNSLAENSNNLYVKFSSLFPAESIINTSCYHRRIVFIKSYCLLQESF